MIVGETVEVIWKDVETGEIDPGGNPIKGTRTEEVEDVLVAPGAREDLDDSQRPAGVTVAWTLDFPKTFTGSLRGALISVRGQQPAPVIGDPAPYTLANTPTRWHMPVEVERIDG